MRREIVVRPEASAEAMDAAHWYDGRVIGLGLRFLGELDDAIETIRNDPGRFPRYHNEIRRIHLRSFPYGVFFAMTDAQVAILAVFHLQRDPRLMRRTLRRR